MQPCRGPSGWQALGRGLGMARFSELKIRPSMRSAHSPDRSFRSADVNTTANTITVPNHGFPSNYRVMLFAYSGSTVPSPFTRMTTPYFVDVVDANTIKLSASSGPGAAVDITNTGSGTIYLIGASIRMAWHANYATSDPTFVAYNSFWNGNSTDPFGWYSTNAGVTWRPFSGFPSGGNIEVNPVGWNDRGRRMYRNFNAAEYHHRSVKQCVALVHKGRRGNIGAEIVIAGVPTSRETGYGNAYYNNHVCVAADRVTTGVFYLFNYVTHKVYRSTNQGETWTAMNAVNLPSTFINQCRFSAVPGHEGHLFISGGLVGTRGDANPGTPVSIVRQMAARHGWRSARAAR